MTFQHGGHACAGGIAGVARSEAERLIVKLLKEAGITGWRTNYPVGGYKVDVAVDLPDDSGAPDDSPPTTGETPPT